ncbi:MAG: hypothetical protein JSW08_01215 [archaeon]|nr:MAG: hypothetical protein JSW08_01215 [archaeon]
MLKNKKGAELSINTVIIIIILLIALVILVLIFTGGMKSISSTIWDKIKSAITLWDAAGVNPG